MRDVVRRPGVGRWALALAVAALAAGCGKRSDPTVHLDVTPPPDEPPPAPVAPTPPAPPAPRPPPPRDGPAGVGAWDAEMNWPFGAVHTHVLPTGKVMFGGEWLDGALPPRLWDPATSALTVAPYAGYNVFCSGHTFLGNGLLLFAGGHIKDDYGFARASVFDPVAGTWTQLADMNAGRWYATTTTLATGEVVVVSGEVAGIGDVNPIPQVLDPVAGTWRTLTTASRSVPFYPRQFAAPNGKLFVATPSEQSLWLDTSGTGAWSLGPPSHFGFRDYGGAVMLDGKVLVMGGGDPPTNTAEMVDLDDPAPAWKVVAPMKFARRQLNATILPDGTVLVTGGSSGPGKNNESAPVLAAEVYDPASDTWTTLSSAAEFRGYHSTAVLLPDGRVLTGGSTLKTTAQVFSPPYLFRGPRPTIAAAPDRVAPGTRFHVETPDATRIVRVALVRLGSVTHAFDQNQRYVTLGFAPALGGLDVDAPPSFLRAPPGHYMLFLVDDDGVPSVASIIQLAN
jgi:Domain of unknown function (DUF1929)/Kelch motif